MNVEVRFVANEGTLGSHVGSYTHLALPTNNDVAVKVVLGSTTKKQLKMMI